MVESGLTDCTLLSKWNFYCETDSNEKKMETLDILCLTADHPTDIQNNNDNGRQHSLYTVQVTRILDSNTYDHLFGVVNSIHAPQITRGRKYKSLTPVTF